MFRRRKHGIAAAIRDVPVGLFCFELLYADGEDLTELPYLDRRARLAEALTLSDRLRLTTAHEVATAAELEAAFEKAARMAQRVWCVSRPAQRRYLRQAPAAGCGSSSRGLRTELADTVDLVVVGGYAGRGRRRGTYGAVCWPPTTQRRSSTRRSANAAPGSPTPNWPRCPPTGATDSQGATRACRLAGSRSCGSNKALVLEILSAELTSLTQPHCWLGQRRKTPGCRCGFLDSPAVATTKSRRTRQPLSSSSSFIALHAGRLPLEGKAPNGN